MKKLLLSAVLFINLAGKAQLVDPSNTILIGQNSTIISLQGQQLAQAIEELGVTKEMLTNAKLALDATRTGVRFAEGTYQLMDEISEGRVNFNLMNTLGMNNLQDLVEQILCIRFEDFVPDNSEYYNIYLNFRNSIINCSNSAYYSMTFPGLVNKLISGNFNKPGLHTVPPPVPTYSAGNVQTSQPPKRNQYNIVTTNSAIAEMDAMIENAQTYASFSTTMNDRLKLEIGYKYLQLADKLYKDADQLYQAITNPSEAVKMEWSARQQLVLSCVDYEMKSFDYKMKGMQLIQDASTAPQAQATMKSKSAKEKMNLINQQVLLGH